MGSEGLTISESEREVMKVLWDCKSATVREIRERLAAAGRKWAHTTINTLLTRLEQKRFVTCDRSGFSHVFAATVSRGELMQQRLTSLAHDFYDGTRVPLMLALADGQEFSDDEIEQFRNLIDQLETGRKRRKRSGGKGRKQ